MSTSELIRNVVESRKILLETESSYHLLRNSVRLGTHLSIHLDLLFKGSARFQEAPRVLILRLGFDDQMVLSDLGRSPIPVADLDLGGDLHSMNLRAKVAAKLRSVFDFHLKMEGEKFQYY